MSLFPQAPKPASALGYYRLLSPTAGVRVSPLCLGAMSFGDAWKGVLGECDKEQSLAILDYYYDNGGNFIDVVCSDPHLRTDSEHSMIDKADLCEFVLGQQLPGTFSPIPAG